MRISHYLLPLDYSFSSFFAFTTSSFLLYRSSSVSVIEVSFPSVLAAESVAIREMDGTYIISYLHLQELK